MSIQFQSQFLLEDDKHRWLRDMFQELGASEEAIEMFIHAIEMRLITPETAVKIIKTTTDINEDGMGGSTTGGGVTNGATFTPGAGEQYAAGTRKVRKSLGEELEDSQLQVGAVVKYQNQDWTIERDLGHSYRLKSTKGLPSTNVDKDVLARQNQTIKTEDAPRLAGSPAKTNKQGARNLNAYTKDGFTKAPSAEAAGKKLKSIDVEELWEEEPLNENYFSFRNETKTRGKSEQFHEAVKIINKKLDEVNRLLEFTGTLKTELSEGEDSFEVKTNTKKAMSKVRGKVVEAYQKLKEL